MLLFIDHDGVLGLDAPILVKLEIQVACFSLYDKERQYIHL